MMLCPCGSDIDYLACCNPCLENKTIPETPEALMRSRYTAYTLGNIDYIRNTMRGKPLAGFDDMEARRWSQSIQWLCLKVITTRQESEPQGFVEFSACYLDKNSVKTIHEISEFEKIHNCWFYTDGKQISVPAISVSRNAPCPCGSQKKFKNCHACN